MAAVSTSVCHAITAGCVLSRRLGPATCAPLFGLLLRTAAGCGKVGPLHYRAAVAHRGCVLGSAEHAIDAPRACHYCMRGRRRDAPNCCALVAAAPSCTTRSQPRTSPTHIATLVVSPGLTKPVPPRSCREGVALRMWSSHRVAALTAHHFIAPAPRDSLSRDHCFATTVRFPPRPSHPIPALHDALSLSLTLVDALVSLT